MATCFEELIISATDHECGQFHRLELL